MVETKVRAKRYYVRKCERCGKEFEVDKDSTNTICWDCIQKEARADAVKALQFFIGAEITDFEPRDTDQYHLLVIKVKTKDGRLFKFEADGWDERYIGYEEVKE
jgi:hypothetical protein